MPTEESISAYRKRRAAFAAESAAARKSFDALSNARLALFLGTLGGLLWFAFRDAALPALAVLSAGAAAFVVLMIRHGKVQARQRLSARMADINEAGIKRMEGTWGTFPADGREFANDKHPYASDLDIFGPASLFQWMSACETRLGRLHLARLLGGTARTGIRAQAIREVENAAAENQEMVRELAPMLEWRQRFQAAGRFRAGDKEDPEALIAWAEDSREIFPRLGFAFALRLVPVFTFSAALAVFLVSGIASGFLLAPVLHLFIASWNNRAHGEMLAAIVRHKENLEAYLDLLGLIESGGFKGPGLAGLVRELGASGAPASASVRALQSMADWMETRNNPFLSFIVNALCLWDMQWLWAFRSWKRGNGSRLRVWLETIARMEALSSLANLPFENPDWEYPGVRGDGPLLEAREMGHPLIRAGARVRNDAILEKPGEILIITGSNMSGKSTLLRTIGVNLVLAYAGAPVCARAFRCAPLEVHTSMRLRDDLEKHISSFYAELLRIKTIIEAAREGRPVLFLVDEIFRGTNSKDRHEGAMAVLRRLHALGAAGLVSTHDLELARLEEMEPAHFRNFHFLEGYSEGKIQFDFRLRPGVSTTTNAIHLIRMVGIT
jgi:ABC-type multidrug transport system fused ATPase/permease subunit